MGWETARELACKGWRVAFTARTIEKALATKSALLAEFPGVTVEAFVVDLDDLKATRAAAQTMATSLSAIDVLVCNAGVMTPPYKPTLDGWESQFQTNYLAHVQLFLGIKDLLLASPTKRVVSISSLSSEKGHAATLDDFLKVAKVSEHDYEPMTSYRESKLAQVLFTQALRKNFAGQGLEAFCVHPGVVNTNLFYRKSSPVGKALMQPVAGLGYLTEILVTPRHGAQTALGLIQGELKGPALYWAARKPRAYHQAADDPALVDALWKWTLEQLSP